MSLSKTFAALALTGASACATLIPGQKDLNTTYEKIDVICDKEGYSYHYQHAKIRRLTDEKFDVENRAGSHRFSTRNEGCLYTLTAPVSVPK
jgi:hypothetical protein